MDLKGNVVRLTNFELPIDLSKKEEEEKAIIENLTENVSNFKLYSINLMLLWYEFGVYKQLVNI